MIGVGVLRLVGRGVWWLIDGDVGVQLLLALSWRGSSLSSNSRLAASRLLYLRLMRSRYRARRFLAVMIAFVLPRSLLFQEVSQRRHLDLGDLQGAVTDNSSLRVRIQSPALEMTRERLTRLN